MKHTHPPTTATATTTTTTTATTPSALQQSIMEEDLSETVTFNPTTDICAQLMRRYSSSSAPQHRHLIATAAAIKSLLLEDSLPLSPLSYFTSAINALSQPQNDVASASALATLLSLVLPLVPDLAISPENAAEGAANLVRVLERETVVGSTSSAKCVVKCLGVLLGFCDLGDWDSVELPFQTLLRWSIDKRPKVRKCALVYLENALKCFQSRSVKKKTSNLILSQLENYLSIAVKLGVIKNNVGSGSERQCEAEQLEIVHALNVVRVALPYLCEKTSAKIILKLIELLDSHSSMLARPVLNAIEAFLEKVEDGIIIQVAEDILNALSSFVSSKTNSKDSISCAANLLKVSLDKLHARDTGKLNRSFPIGIKAISGLLTCEDDIASKSSSILKNLFSEQLSDIGSHLARDSENIDEESEIIASISSIFMELLDSFAGIPNEHILSVLSVLFLKLGRSSMSYTRDIVLKLAEIFTHADANKHDTSHLQKCFGCAIVAMGAENILSLVPISFDQENSTSANVWILPILKKYICGASLGYFMEHIVPIAQSLKKASRKVKKSVTGQDLQALSRGLWGLLPAFCRQPTDISKNFQSFAKLMVVRLKKDSSMHEDIADALQELVKQNKPKSDASIIEPVKHSIDFSLEDYLLERKNLLCYSKKAAIRNIKALSMHMHDLLLALMTTFLDSTPNKRSSLKKAISCLASISDSTVTKKIFVSSLERFSSVKAAVSGDSDPSNSSISDLPLDASTIGDNPQWSLILDLASSIVEGADEELVDLIFRSTKHALQAGDGKGVSEAYHTLSCILEEHPWFCSVKMDELVDLIIGLKSPSDIASFSNRLSCLQLLLVHALKQSSQDTENTKPFLILNDLILALKDSREEARKTAYDSLLKISSCVADSSIVNPDGPYNRLISMILGYLSGPSPHITSAAISALSVLVFKEPELCMKVPHVVSSVTSLLQTKAVETIKAVLGFIKVLVSCLEAKDLEDFVPPIVDGVLPWSSISRHHFRSKVTVILEILIRKCGYPTIKLLTPERYQSFVRKVSQSRHGKTASKDADSPDVDPHHSNDPTNGPKKRSHNETNDKGSGSEFRSNKRRKQMQDSQSPTPSDTRSNVGGFDKKSNRFQRSESKFGQNQRPEKFGRGPGNTTRSNDRGIDKKVKRFQHYKPKSGQNQRSQKFNRASGSNRMKNGPKNGQKGESRR
ncbi:RRP12-like protein [Bienertia sinuspersici]